MPANRVMYIEQKTADGSLLNDRGAAEIGEVSFSKTGTTIYFKGKSFRKASVCAGRRIGPGFNYVCVETGDGYWISGVKKRGTNRHWAGGGPVTIDSTGEKGRTPAVKEREKARMLDQIRAGLETAAQKFLQTIRQEEPTFKVRVFLFDIHEYTNAPSICGEAYSDDWSNRGDHWNEFEDVNRLLQKAYSLSFFKPFDGGLRELCLDACRGLDAKGVFGADEQRMNVVIGVDNPFGRSYDISEKAFFACAKQLNPPQAIQRLRRELKRRKQTTGQ